MSSTSTTEVARLFEADPALNNVFTEFGWNASDYVRTMDTIMRTMIAIAMRDADVIKALPGDVLPANVELLQNLPTDLAPPFRLWRETTLEPAVRELREIQKRP